VLPVVDNPWMYVVAIIAGTLVTALMINALKTISQRNARQDVTPEASSAPGQQGGNQ